MAICWASLFGALLWFIFGPETLLYVAFVIGCLGAAVFDLWVPDTRVAPKEPEPAIEV